LLERLAEEHTTYAGVRFEGPTVFPKDLAAFFHSTNGAELFGQGDLAAYGFAPWDKLEALDFGESACRKFQRNQLPLG
jgi:hypothetical protein